MQKIAIVTDSNSGITQAEAKQLGVFAIPMPFLIDGEEYYEDINLTQEQFYQKLTGGSEVSTSQPSLYEVVELWKEILKTYDQIVHIPMSSGLSASYDTALSASKEFDGKVEVVDNKRISVTLKRAVIDALTLSKQNKPAKEIREDLEKTGPQSSIYIMLSTLKYLKKGGRITPAAAAIGSFLKIKPVLQIQGAKLDKFCQVINYNQGKTRMIDQIRKDLTTRFPDLLEKGQFVMDIAHTNCEDKALVFKQEVETAFADLNVKVNVVDPLSLSVACHIGDGAIALTVTINELN